MSNQPLRATPHPPIPFNTPIPLSLCIFLLTKYKNLLQSCVETAIKEHRNKFFILGLTTLNETLYNGSLQKLPLEKIYNFNCQSTHIDETGQL